MPNLNSVLLYQDKEHILTAAELNQVMTFHIDFAVVSGHAGTAASGNMEVEVQLMNK